MSAADRGAGVVAASAGNHAQGVAYHAHLLGIAATIVMPADTPFTKVTNTAYHGAHGRARGRRLPGRVRGAQRIAAETGATLVPAFDDPLVIAGQGTIGLEILDRLGTGTLDAIVVPVGGGGLISGIAVAVKALRPEVRIIGVQAEGYAGMLHAVDRAPAPQGGPTIAEGIAVAHPGTLTRASSTRSSTTSSWSRNNGSKKRSRSAPRSRRRSSKARARRGSRRCSSTPALFHDQNVVVVFSGGNIDVRMLSSVLLRALARSGRLVRLQIELPDRPGMLALVAEIVGSARANIVDVEHRRDLPGVAVKSVRLDLSVETRDRAPRRRDRRRAGDGRLSRRGRVITVRLANARRIRPCGRAHGRPRTRALPVDHLFGGYDERILDTATRARGRRAGGGRRRTRRRFGDLRRRQLVGVERVDRARRGAVPPARRRPGRGRTRRGRRARRAVHGTRRRAPGRRS